MAKQPRELLEKALEIIEHDLDIMDRLAKNPRSVPLSGNRRSPAETAAVSRVARDLQSMAGMVESEVSKRLRELARLSDAEIRQQLELARQEFS